MKYVHKTVAGGTKPPTTATPENANPTIQVWDPVVRLFHWTLVIAFAVAWTTGEELQRLHEVAGYMIAGLVSVRVLWGFMGSPHARFSDFLYRPSAVAGHLVDTLRFRGKRYIGHNPAGGAMVLALLLMLAVTCMTGIMMTTDAFWSVEWVEDAHEISANLAIVLVGLHLAGVLVASVEHGENLVKAMITGRKRR